MTIDRAIEILDPEHRECYDGLDEVNEACRMGMEALERTRWIPCSERLPDLIPCKAGTAYSEKVIVWITGRKAMVCVWDGKDWLVPSGFWEVWGKDVTHWMPLPEPPEEGGAENAAD